MTLLKQSTAVDIAMGPFLDETDGKTAETGLTITQPDIRLKKNGGAWAQKNAAQTLSHEEAGWYEVALDTTDTNTLGELVVAIHESGALPVWRVFQVVPANVYDSLVGGSDLLQVDVQELEGDGQSSLDLKDFADAGYDPATNKVEGVKTADALTANSDKTGYRLSATGVDDIWDEDVDASHQTAGTAGKKLDDAGSAGDPWGTALPGSYGAGTAGKIVGDNLNATVGSRATQTSVDTIDDFLDTEVAAIKAKTDNLPSDPADESALEALIDALPTAAENADAVWDEAIAGHAGAGSTGLALAGASAPSAGAVADAVWDEALSGHLGAGSTGAALNAASAGSVAGAGAISWDVLVQVGVNPVQGAAVWVATDAAGTNVVAGSLITPSNGTVTFLLDAGTYYAFVRKDGLNPVNGQSFVVS